MKTRWMTAAALLLAAACGGGSAPPEDGPAPAVPAGPAQAGTGMNTRVGGGAPNVTSLLGAREALGLTSAQVTALDSIRGAWAEVDMRLRAEMRDGGAAGAIVGMAENNAAAHDAIEQVLTPEQRSAVCAIPGSRVAGAPAGPPRGRRGEYMRRRARGLPGDSVPAMHLAGGWPWCG